MALWPILALAAAGAAPAGQDLTATYSTGTGGMELSMKVEVAANGNLRADMNLPGMYMIKRDGRSYYVLQMPEGPLVEDLEDAAAVMQEEMAKMDPQLCEAVRDAGPPLDLVSRGTVTVAGRTGEAYSTAGSKRSHPDVVISHDPALAPLGAAMAAQFRLSQTALGRCGRTPAHFAQMQALLDRGTALRFGPMQLEKVEYGPVDPARFVLPAAPASREVIRAQMIRQGHSPAVVVIERPN